MKKLGLDLGSSSIGWLIREGETIKGNGVITFQSGMMKGQTGGYNSPTKERRTARSKRRLIQARKYRKWALLKVLFNEFVPLDKTELEKWSKYKKGEVQKFPENEKFLKWIACDFTYEDGKKYQNPYQLRVRALDNKLSQHEFGRALYHLVQRRGYKNIGENENEEFDVELAKKDTETKTQIDRREQDGFVSALANNKTIAEALQNEFLEKGKRARNQYRLRREYKNEFEKICEGQGYDISQNEKGKYNNDFVQKLYNAIIWQRPLRSQKGNIGKCTLEPTKPRCPVSHPLFEIFRAWSFINTIKYFDEQDEKQNISREFRNLLFDFFLKQDKNFKFEKIRETLDKLFKAKKKYNYPIDKEGKYDTSVSGMPVCKGLINVFGDKAKNALSAIHNFNIGNAPKVINAYSIYDLWHILFEFDEKHLEKLAVEKLGIENKKDKNEKEYNQFADLKDTITQGYADLSIKAMVKIIPFLKEGFLYNEAVVLAKIPELLGDKWATEKNKIFGIVKETNEIYNSNKRIIGITNNLIDYYKGLEYPEIYAHKDFKYELGNKHDDEILKSCEGYFGKKSWESKNKNDRDEIFNEVKNLYQLFLNDEKRAYHEVPLLTDIFKELLKKDKIEINGNLYHHSNRENIYLKKSVNKKTGEIELPKDKKTGLEILPQPRIDSIKNPMFNKSLSILRKLVNELITTRAIDSETEIVVEVASELNDNNKRAAIERYQNEKKNKREKYCEFLNEFKRQENNSINVDESIAAFEMWTEQTFEETTDENNQPIKNKNRNEILKEKEAIKRYELWMEQKGQCMYTGKMISITQLFSNEIDIMHTIPRSLLPDNTMANMTVGYSRYNRDLQKQKFPKECDNYYKDVEGWGTRIEPRLNEWIKIRDRYKNDFENRLKPRGGEDEANKNKRIQEKHYYKMHYDYWKDKVERFEAEEVKDSWARRQLVDTQMISKYAREFLKTVFKKVAVQKGTVTADFRKIYSFQEQDEIKSRNRHTHHSIDAVVLTLIPTNSSHRDKLLKKMYEMDENENKQFTTTLYPSFNSQNIIQHIENNTLIVNYQKDNILKETYKTVRKRGKKQYVKNKKGKFIFDKNGNQILKIAKGDSVRSTLFKDTFIAKIMDVERDKDKKPLRDEQGNWKFKKEKFTFVKRVPLKDAIINVDDIVDPVIQEIVRQQKENATDPQGKKIRHIRIYTKAGQKVKERVNYRSEHDYKNNYYSAAGSLPYAILLQKTNNGKIERAMIPIASFEIAKKERFKIDDYISKKYPEYADYPDKKLLKVGQKVIVLKEDKEFEKRFDVDFQTKRLYKITQFGTSDNNIYLKYHTEAREDGEIDLAAKTEKDLFIRELEKKYNLPEVIENISITDNKARKEDFEKRKFSFKSLNDFRFKRLKEHIEKKELSKIYNAVKKIGKQSALIKEDGKTPLLKMSNENWNFLYEGKKNKGYDFEVSILGEIEIH